MHFSNFFIEEYVIGIGYWIYGRKMSTHLKFLLQKFKSKHSYELFNDLNGALFSKVPTLGCRHDNMSHTFFDYFL
jgi:hypothetical protein